MHSNLPSSWQRIVPNLKETLSLMQEKTLIGFGMVPYPRVVPSFFLQNYTIYTAKDTADVDILRAYGYSSIFCMEEKFPKAAEKIHSASYLLGNYAFHAFLKSRKMPVRLLLHRITPDIVKKLEEQNIEWIGNKPETFQAVWLKTDFHNLLGSMHLPNMGSMRVPREQFLAYTFQQFIDQHKMPFLVQRAFSNTGIEQTPFIIQNEDDWEDMMTALSLNQKFEEVHITRILQGLTLFMAGCVTRQGILSSSLQLQLMDIKETLAGKEPGGLQVGHDLGFCSWEENIELAARNIVEKTGETLAKNGYKGIFGVSFMYDQKTKLIYAKECVPQSPEDLHIYSLGILGERETPPMDFFHIAEHLAGEYRFDFNSANTALQKRVPISHIFISREGVYKMNIPLRPGIYSFNAEHKELTFQREQAFPWEIKNDSEFLMLDSMPRPGKPVIGNVPSLFKLIFRQSIATSSETLRPHIAEIISTISAGLRKDQQTPDPKTA
ncbi:MAG: hypothetical protein HY482_02315 [Candidatus Wildermuthbacteria bacterium]|nr:hypothetical protein [Candidatus Wildermuthbacteria bacterium]